MAQRVGLTATRPGNLSLFQELMKMWTVGTVCTDCSLTSAQGLWHKYTPHASRTYRQLLHTYICIYNIYKLILYTYR